MDLQTDVKKKGIASEATANWAIKIIGKTYKELQALALVLQS